jgi:3-deoxy-D-manno-octulosonic-acid transferase
VTLPRIYRLLTGLLQPLAVLSLRWRCRRGKEDPRRLPERYGFAGSPRPPGPIVWIHAASVGEAIGTLSLIERLLQARPGIEVLLTTGTTASARLLERRLPTHARHQFVPLDLSRSIARFLDHWRPDLAIWVESELWPNLVLATQARHIPMVLVNGRLSARSYRRWRLFPGLIRPLLGAFTECLAQDDEQAVRLRRLGAPQVESIGNLKASAAALPVDPQELERLRQQIGKRPVWLAASTHAGEEEIAARVHRRLRAAHRDMLTLIAPRHPARAAEIAAILADFGLKLAQRSAGAAIAADTDIYLADTMGELGLFYRLAGIAFVGGSLTPRGGHNPFEPARLGCAVLHGPDMRNCADLAAALAAAGASKTVGNDAELAGAVSVLLGRPRLRAERVAAGARVVAAGAGVLDAIDARLAPWLDRLVPTAVAADGDGRDPLRLWA